MRQDITLVTAPSLETGPVSSAATVAKWDTRSVVAPSLLQRRRMVLATLGAKLEAKLPGVQQAQLLSKKRLADGMLALRK